MKPFLFVFLSCIITLQTQAQHNLQIDDLWQLSRVSPECLTPDGSRLIYGISTYSVPDNKGERNLFSIPVQGGESKSLTSTLGSESEVIRTPSGKMGYIYKGQLWESSWDGTDAKQLSNFEGGTSLVKFAPDGNHLLFTRDVKVGKTKQDLYPELSKSTAEVYDDLMYRHWDTWEDGNYSHVFVADFNNGKISNEKDIMQNEAFDCPQMPNGGAEDMIWSSDSKHILYVCKKLTGKAYAISTNTDIYDYALVSGETTNKTQDNKGYDTQPAYQPIGTKIAWLSMVRDGYEADKNRLVIFDPTTGTSRDLTANFDETVESFRWSKDGSRIYFLSPTNGTVQLYEALATAPKAGKASIRQITSGPWDLTGIVGEIAGALIVGRTDMNHALEVFRVDLKTGQLFTVTESNKQKYQDIKMSKVEERWIKTTDGKQMLTFVIYPPDFDSTKKYPALLYCQGGPQSAVSQFYSFRWNFQLMASQGYIVIAPCRRGMPGFGTQWNEEISGDWGGQAIRDYLSATDSISKLPFVDRKRLGAVGASYGGYSVYMLEGLHNGRFKTFIAHCGLFDLESWYLTTEEMWFANWDIGGNFWDQKKPAAYDRFNPRNYLANWNTPILVIHGAMDFRVPVNQGMEAYQAAQLKGIKSRFLYFPDEGHWIMRTQDGVLWQKEFYRWLKETL